MTVLNYYRDHGIASSGQTSGTDSPAKPPVRNAPDDENVYSEYAPDVPDAAPGGYGYWLIGAYGELVKCDGEGTILPRLPGQGIGLAYDPPSHTVDTTPPMRDRESSHHLREIQGYNLKERAFLTSFTKDSSYAVHQGADVFQIDYIEQAEILAALRNASEEETPIYSNVTPYKREFINFYKYGLHGERIACDIKGEAGKIFLPQAISFSAADKTLIYGDLALDGKSLLGFHRLGALNERIRCNAEGKTGTGLDQKRIMDLERTYEFHRNHPEYNTLWTHEFDDHPFMGEYIDTLNADNPSFNIVHFAGGQLRPSLRLTSPLISMRRCVNFCSNLRTQKGTRLPLQTLPGITITLF